MILCWETTVGNSTTWGISSSTVMMTHKCLPPPMDWVKINVDESCSKSGKIGFGGIARDDKDNRMGGFFSQVCHSILPFSTV